jgi:hypothetical protein
MSLQKEKGLSPQKKNLKPKRESEASGPESPSQTDLHVGAEESVWQLQIVATNCVKPIVIAQHIVVATRKN